ASKRTSCTETSLNPLVRIQRRTRFALACRSESPARRSAAPACGQKYSFTSLTALGKMRADRIDHRGLLANEQMAGAMEHQAALLLRGLGRDEPHVCSGDRFANGLSVCSIVLLPLDVGPHVGRRHQAHRMTKSLQFARPMMG